MFVLDASVSAAWLLSDESSTYADRLLKRLAGSGEALVPAIWRYEMANVLWVGVRRERLSAVDAAQLTQWLAALPISIDPGSVDAVPVGVAGVAALYDLSVYDAAYLELALRKGLPLASLDQRLLAAAKVAGISLEK
jgi:predicted nucleic acid-binding protein